MGNTRDTGFLRNFITRDGSGNVTISGNVSFSGTVSGYATQSYVGTQLAALVASAPATLDTLNELAAALGSDPNFATTVTNSIATKLSLSGGTLTGLLDIAQAGGATQVAGLRLTNTSNAANTGSYLAFKEGGYATDTSRIVSMRDGAGNGSIFYISNRIAGSLAYALYINSSNNIGIGTTSPTGKLHVVLPAFTNEDTDSQQAIFGSGTLGYGVRIGYNESNSIGYIYSLKPGVAWSSLQFAGNNLIFCGGGSTEAMRINSSRYLGIGTTTPTNLLTIANNSAGTNGIDFQSYASAQVLGKIYYEQTNDTFRLVNRSTYSTGGIIFITGGDTSERMRITSGGNVLIGTTSDSGYPFIVAKARDGWQAAFVNISSYGTQQVFLSHGEGYGAYIDSGSAGNSSSRYIFKAVSGGSARFTVRGDGNVGIGTESPSHRLQVAGNIYSTDTVFGRNLKPESWAGISAGSPSSAGIPLGYSSINISSLCDNNWRTILSNINDTKVFMWVVLGDAASKDTASYTWQMTSPAYGVSNFAQISYLDGGWNTGGFEFTYSSANGTYSLLVRTTSYYSSSYTAQGNIYFLRIE